jgi:hypothetical protein
MVFFSAITAGALLKGALLVASVVYQRNQARKAKNAANAAADAAKGFEVTLDFSSEPVFLVYGLGKVGGNVVWGDLRGGYTHVPVNKTGKGLKPITNINSSRDLQRTVSTPTLLPQGAFISYGNKLFERNSTASALDLPAASNLTPDEIFSTYYISLDSSFSLSELLQQDLATTETQYANIVSESGDRENKDERFFASSSTNIDFTHSTLEASVPDGGRNEFLFLQQAVCVGGINRVITAEINGKPINDPEFNFGQRIDFCVDTSSATNPMILTNNPMRTNALFSNIAHASMCFRLNRDDPQYSGIPQVEFIVEGKKVRDIVFVDGEYQFGGLIYSNSPVLVLADYLTNSVYGRGLSDDNLDLESFFKSNQVATTVVSENSEYSGYAAMSRGAIDSVSTLQGATRLYTADLTLDTSQNVWNNIETILSTMNDPSLIWSEGRYKLHLDYPASIIEQEELVATTLTEDDVLFESLSVTYPSQDERLNQMTVRFRNANKKFTEDSVTWPKRNSSVLNTYLAQDNGVELKTDLFAAGASNPYQAQAIAEQSVRDSRYGAVVEFSAAKRAISIEPGDLVRLSLPSLDLDQVVRISESEIEEGLSTNFKATFFDWQTLAWNADDNQAGIPLPVPSGFVQPVSDLQLNTLPSGPDILNNNNVLSWSYPNRTGYQFRVEYQRVGDEDWITLGTTSSLSFSFPELTGGFYVFSVKAVNQANKSSIPVFIQSANIDSAVANLTVASTSFTTGGTTQTDGTFVTRSVFSWVPGDNSRVKFFRVRYRQLSQSADEFSFIETTDNSVVIAGLVSDVEYVFQVTGVSSNGTEGEWTSRTATVGKDNTPPAPPTSVVAIPQFKSVKLDWVNPTDADFSHSEISTSTDVFIASITGTSIVIPTTNFSSVSYKVRSVDYSGNVSTRVSSNSVTPLRITAETDIAGDVKALLNDAGLSPIEIVGALPTTSNFVGRTVYLTTENSQYQWDGAEWKLTQTEIGPNSITSSQIADLAATKISGQLTNDQITSIEAAKISGQIVGTQISDNSISTGKITANAVVADKIAAGSVLADKIAANAVTATAINAGAVTTGKLAVGAVVADNIAANSVTADKVAANAITSNKIAANAITSGLIAAGAVTADKILANSITAGQLDTSELITNSAQIGDGIITTAKIGDLQVSRLKLETGSVTSFDLISTPVVFTGQTTYGTDALIGTHTLPISADPSQVPERIILRPRVSGSFPNLLSLANGFFGAYYRIRLKRDRDGDITELKTYIEPSWQFGTLSNFMQYVLYAGRPLSAVLQVTQAGSYQAGDDLIVEYYWHRFRSGSVDAAIDIQSYDLEIEEYYR